MTDSKLTPPEEKRPPTWAEIKDAINAKFAPVRAAMDDPEIDPETPTAEIRAVITMRKMTEQQRAILHAFCGRADGGESVNYEMMDRARKRLRRKLGHEPTLADFSKEKNPPLLATDYYAILSEWKDGNAAQRGRYKFLCCIPKSVPEPPDDDKPFGIVPHSIAAADYLRARNIVKWKKQRANKKPLLPDAFPQNARAEIHASVDRMPAAAQATIAALNAMIIRRHTKGAPDAYAAARALQNAALAAEEETIAAARKGKIAPPFLTTDGELLVEAAELAFGNDGGTQQAKLKECIGWTARQMTMQRIIQHGHSEIRGIFPAAAAVQHPDSARGHWIFGLSTAFYRNTADQFCALPMEWAEFLRRLHIALSAAPRINMTREILPLHHHALYTANFTGAYRETRITDKTIADKIGGETKFKRAPGKWRKRAMEIFARAADFGAYEDVQQIGDDIIVTAKEIPPR